MHPDIAIKSATRCDGFEYAIRSLVLAAEETERAGKKVTYLNIGDPQAYGFRPPSHIVDPVTRALRDGFTGYAHSAGLVEAREAVAEFATGLGAPTHPDHVLMTSGASEAADLVLTALLNHGDEVLLPAPGYPLYAAILNKLGAVARYYELADANQWLPDPAQVASLVTPRTRALVLLNPSNPTGAITPDAVTEQLLQLALERKLLVIADEVYRELCFGEAPAPSSALAQRIPVPVVTLESMSKTYLVPGWRVGWMRFTYPEKMPALVAAVRRLADGRLCSPTPTQYAVSPGLQGSHDFLTAFKRDLRKRRDLAMHRVRASCNLRAVQPDAAFYMMIKLEDSQFADDQGFVLDFLRSTGFLVVHGSGFGANPQRGYFRLVYLASENVLGCFFDDLERFLETRPQTMRSGS